MSGRPRSELAPTRRRELERAQKRVTSAETKLEEARADLSRVIAEAMEDGASGRVVGDAIGMSKSNVHLLIQRSA